MNAVNRWLAPVILGFIAMLCYVNTISNDYSVDDTKSSGQNNQVKQGLSGIPEILTTPWDFSEDPNSGEIGHFEYRPVAKVTFAVEHQFFGANPHISHAVNGLLYALLISLLLVVLQTVSQERHYQVLVLATLMFALHPIHTEVVANLKNREVLLGFIFGLGSWWYTMRFVQGEEYNFRHAIRAIVLFSLGVLSKMDAGIFAIIIPGSLWYFNKTTIRTATGIALVMVGCFLIVKLTPTLWLPEWHRVYHYWENPVFKDRSWDVWLTVVFNSFLYNLRLLVFPHPLCFYYGYNTVPFGDLLSPFFLGGLGTFILLTMSTVVGVLKRTLWSFGMLIFFVGISPFLNVILPVTGIVADRYLFVASLGFCIAISSILVWAYEKQKSQPVKVGMLVFLLIVSGLMIWKVVHRNQDWKNRLTLYRTDAKNYPNSAKVNVMLGYRLSTIAKETFDIEIKNKLLNEALLHFEKAKAILPTMESVNGDIGYIYAELEQYPEAIRAYNQELAIEYNDVHVHNNLGVLYYKLGLLEPSLDHFETAVGIDSSNLNIRVDLLSAYILGDLKTDTEIQISFIEQNSTTLNVPFVEVGDYFLRTRKDTCKAIEYYTKASERGFDELGFENWLNNFKTLKPCPTSSAHLSRGQ